MILSRWPFKSPLEVIIIAGGAGTGKTTTSVHLLHKFNQSIIRRPWSIVEKDASTNILQTVAYEISGDDPEKRAEIRKATYFQHIPATTHYLTIGYSVIICSPLEGFLAKDSSWLKEFTNEIGKNVKVPVNVTKVWLKVAPKILTQRLQDRGEWEQKKFQSDGILKFDYLDGVKKHELQLDATVKVIDTTGLGVNQVCKKILVARRTPNVIRPHPNTFSSKFTPWRLN